jgi:hypothetical protein
VLALVEAAAHRGRDVIVVAPVLVRPDPWLYAGLVGELADHLVLCVEDGGQGHAEEVALPVLDRYDCPAPIVLLGGRASHLDRVRVRARALLEVGSGGGDLLVAATLQALTGDQLTTDSAVRTLVADARAAPFWARFHLLLVRQHPVDDVHDAALSLLEELVELLGSSDSEARTEQTWSVLHAVVVRMDFWVDHDSVGAERRLNGVAARLLDVGDEGASVAKELQAFCRRHHDRAPQRRGPSGLHSDHNSECVEAQMHYIEAGRTCSSKTDFAEVLEQWIEHADRETTIGQPSTYAGKPLVWTELDGQRFYLNGDTRDAGVRKYLDLVRQTGPELPWHVIANTRGKVNKVAFGEPPTPLKHFYLYAKDEAASPYRL